MKVKIIDRGDNIQLKFTSEFNGTVSSWEDGISRPTANVILESLGNVLHGKVDKADLDLPDLCDRDWETHL